MIEWGFIGYETFVACGSSTTDCKFISRCGLVVAERALLSKPPHHSQTSALTNTQMSFCGKIRIFIE